MDFKYQVILLVAGLGLVCGCNEHEILTCMHPLLQLAGHNVIRPQTHTEESYNEICDTALPEFKDCIAGHTENCDPQVKMSYDALILAMDEMCKIGWQDFEEMSICISDDTLKKEIDACEQTMQREASSTQDKDKVCGLVNDYVGCVIGHVDSKCGQDAADYMLGVVKKTTEPMLEAVGSDCEINGSPSSVTSISALILGFAAVMLSFLTDY